MEYQIIKKNETTDGGAIDFTVKISKVSEGKIQPIEKFTIQELDSKDREDLTYTLYVFENTIPDNDFSDIDSDGTYLLESNRHQRSKKYYDFKKNDREFQYIVLKIRGKKEATKTSTINLEIILNDKTNGSEKKFPLTIQNVTSSIKILSFSATPAVLQGNTTPIELNWQIKGDKYTYTLWEGDKKIDQGNSENNKKQSYATIPPIGDHTYTLEVKNDDVCVSEKIRVKGVDGSLLSEKSNPKPPFVIANICAAQKSDYLFCLMLKTENGVVQIDHIGYTQNAFFGEWSRIELSEEEKKSLQPFILSPLVHLQFNDSDKNSLGKLFFVGGSSLETNKTSNAIAAVDLKIKNDDTDDSKVFIHSKNIGWKARMGHTCVVFPFAEKDCIWVIGGADESGNALNDIWVSENGEVWKGWRQKPENENKSPWEARFMASIAIELDVSKKKNALWFGGGFNPMNEEQRPDIWRFDKHNWSKIPSLSFPPDYMSSGMISISNENNNSSDLYIMGGLKHTQIMGNYFNKVIKSDQKYTLIQHNTSINTDSFDTRSLAVIRTVFFQGCLWYIVLSKDEGVHCSKLYYWVPPLNSKTLIL
ncbi:galactose oxidase-like protein [Aquimarina sp. MAR_2010_214]|uniref:Kelch repeat-containing protein n=1 Tax=Aquimarina sp. MAR_2010_214 TaxID=1250026 RepID=UPI000C70B2E6|nr:kelch repeat-containing protein [Aquimarina sp. MAR_2010_214]PKV50553.1 galactose oxidase-like protein [Aquimarina sp. MAR_2010_214]